MENVNELINEIHTGLCKWYDFKPDSLILYIGNENLQLDNVNVELISLETACQINWQNEHQQHFDYIISAATLEKCNNPTEILKQWKKLLKSDGHLLLGMNNRFGLRYFCGDRDPYTNRNFDSIENYYQAYANEVDTFNGKMYNRAEIEKILVDAGFNKLKFFSVLPDLQNPSLIYSEGYLPNEDLANRIFPSYNYPNTVFMMEEIIYKSLIDNKMFHRMANAYLIDCSLSETVSDVVHVTLSIDRGKEDALFTIIHKNGIVEKRAVYPEGRHKLKDLNDNMQDLKKHGIEVVTGKLTSDNRYLMPYIKAEVGQLYLKRLLLEDKEKFLKAMDKFSRYILNSSEIVDYGMNNDIGVVLRKGYVDMVPLNTFYVNDEFVFYDQEFYIENCPANVLIARMILTFYVGNVEANNILPENELYARYGILKDKDKWVKMGQNFIFKIRNDKELAVYHSKVRRKMGIVNANRQRINYSAEDYQRIFVDIFKNADTRKLILFGSGRRADNFMEFYGSDYDIYAIIDNNNEQWNQKLRGITIQSPDLLKTLQSGEYKIIICIKSYLSVMNQLDEMGVTDYCVYEPGNNYPRKRKPIITPDSNVITVDSDKPVKKKYHTGYIAGVFDLFHIGHLNMFKRAKEQCDYLIVGVVPDESVRLNKKTEPFIPFEERVEMVRSCRYVDEVVRIPIKNGSTEQAWKMHHFDVQFSGSDYVNDGEWLANKEFLNQHGADLVFFSYTESTSSTKLKKLIDQKLI